MPRLMGEHIMLREYKAEDLVDIRRWVNEPMTAKFLSTRYWSPQTMVNSEAYLNRMLQGSPNGYYFVIADLENERYLGQMDMFRVDWLLRCGELGMIIGLPEERSKGYGTEALGLMEKFAFQTLGLERLELDVNMENMGAQRCYVKAGFFLEGVKRHAYYSEGKYCDVGMMSILKDEWQK